MKMPLDLRWMFAERRAERAYENDPASGLSCGPVKVNYTEDRLWAHKGAWIFSFGAYDATHVLAYGALDDALESAAAWLAEHAPGHLTEPDYGNARNEILGESGIGDDMLSEEAIAEHAEADLTYTESGWLLSHEWTCMKLHDPSDLLKFVKRA